MPETITMLTQRPDGTEALVLRTASVSVAGGPDKGACFTIDQPHVLIGTGAECQVRLSDNTVSRTHAEIRVTDRGYLLRDLESTNGTVVAGMQVVEALLVSPVSITVGQSVLQFNPTDNKVEIPLSPRGSFGELLGQSIQMRRIFAILERVAPTETTVLLEGKSGTGKELAAHGIHLHSKRAEQPFVVVDCGAIPATLIESELFGHERGAFTGAGEARPGALAEADGGTVFLDEVGELPLDLQPKLLRFLERRQVKRVGSSRYAKVDARVVAATNKELSTEVKEGRYREDLFYRLSVVRIELPTLRDRHEDIILLAHHFAQAFQPDTRGIITEEISELLTSYNWPGNVRQLRHVVEQLAVVPELATQTLRDGSSRPPSPSIGNLADMPFHEARRQWLDIFEREYLTSRMSRANNIVASAANGAGLPRQSFYRMLRRHGLKGA